MPASKNGSKNSLPFNPDSISAEKPADRAKYEKKYGLAPAGAKRMPPAEVKSKVRVTGK